MITIIAFTSANANARESYAGRGAWIGAIPGGLILGGIFAAGASIGQGSCLTDCPSLAEATLLGGSVGLVIGSAAGAAIGALIGLVIPKNKNVPITPTFNPTPGAVGSGVNLSLNF